MHADIKMSNILVSSNKRRDVEKISVKLADFGSAVHLDHPKVQGTKYLVGTPGYIAPELLLGQKVGPPTDIYSLGALMFNLLTSDLPFWDDDRQKRNRRVCLEPLNLETVPLLRQLSRDGRSLLKGMLTKDPVERFNIEQIMSHPWLEDD